MSLPTGTSSVTSASGIPRRRRRSPSLSVPSGKIGSFPPKPSSGAENEGRCGIALVPFPEEAAFHNRDQEFESVFLQRRESCANLLPRAIRADQPAAKIVADAAEIIGEGNHPERGTVY